MEVSADFDNIIIYFENLPEDVFDDLKETFELFDLEYFKRIWDEGQLGIKVKFVNFQDFCKFSNFIDWDNLKSSENKNNKFFNLNI